MYHLVMVLLKSVDATHAIGGWGYGTWFRLSLDELLLELMRKHIIERELVRRSILKSIVPFITPENMVSERENLVRMFTSEAWSTSPLEY
ncbi:uncharacterized protein M6B38_397100 [Iris pallida]|uniref:Uncharacterized protein n=1 Tax=Iris pallida TaxID=29817 RepID=A0AAX6FWL7_IRIPA|nr:uncharacterized protein M6B38_397100 [Iris pallida]